MKLFELELTPVKKSIRTVDRPKIVDATRSKSSQSGSNLERLGNPGVYAAAYEHKRRPGTVLKVGRFDVSPFEDGYLSFVQAVLKNNRGSSNPYLPRIYSVRIYRPKDVSLKGGQYVVEMEKLFKVRELEPEELTAIGEKLFSNWNNPGDPFRYLARQLHMAASGNTTILKTIKDKKLLQALSIVHGIERRKRRISDIGIDLHDGNIMIRRTSVGPQLVITDPLA